LKSKIYDKNEEEKRKKAVANLELTSIELEKASVGSSERPDLHG
jgi:hypothetical protein